MKFLSGHLGIYPSCRIELPGGTIKLLGFKAVDRYETLQDGDELWVYESQKFESAGDDWVAILNLIQDCNGNILAVNWDSLIFEPF